MTTVAAHRPNVVVRPAQAADTKTLADVLARSFWDDPVMSWMIPKDRSRYARLKLFFKADLPQVHARGTVLTTDDCAGAALWLPPGAWRTPKLAVIRHLPAMARAFGTRIPPALKLLTQMEKIHPIEPHWYLSVIGTDPARQGFGVGGALITEITDRCNTEGIGAYLESSKLANVAYYERFGFKVTDEVSVTDSPTLWAMWRDPA